MAEIKKKLKAHRGYVIVFDCDSCGKESTRPESKFKLTKTHNCDKGDCEGKYQRKKWELKK
jgi:DNA replicative helicase MCM subunit Mcm2 (Cdc46/Mcm family)